MFGACAVMILGLWALPVHAGVNVWQKDDAYIDVGLLVQTQGRQISAGGAGTDPNTDSIFFRRLRPFFYGAFNKNWQGIIQMDFGDGFEGQDLKTSVQFAYMEYLGDVQARSGTGPNGETGIASFLAEGLAAHAG